MFEESKKEYNNLPENEWIRQWFCETSGGYVATHRFKAVDCMNRPGIVAEVNGCRILAESGKHVLRLPENILSQIDNVLIDGKPYRNLLKFKTGEILPRGYPDVYFDGQTWDFKTSKYQKTKSIRKLILDGRKADNIIFVLSEKKQLEILKEALHSEVGNRMSDGSWIHIPNVYYMCRTSLVCIWQK